MNGVRIPGRFLKSQSFMRSRSFIRNQSSAMPSVKKRPTFRDLLRTPTTKSLLLTIVFGSTVTEMIARRRNLETLRENHSTKMTILLDVIERLKNGENVDLQQELKLLNNLSSGDSNIEIDFDEELQKLFSESTEVSGNNVEPRSSPDRSVPERPSPERSAAPATTKFL